MLLVFSVLYVIVRSCRSLHSQQSLHQINYEYQPRSPTILIIGLFLKTLNEAIISVYCKTRQKVMRLIFERGLFLFGEKLDLMSLRCLKATVCKWIEICRCCIEYTNYPGSLLRKYCPNRSPFYKQRSNASCAASYRRYRTDPTRRFLHSLHDGLYYSSTPNH